MTDRKESRVSPTNSNVYIMNPVNNKYEDEGVESRLHLQSLPGPGLEALCPCEAEEEGRSLVCPCGPCWALGPGAAVGADPGLPHPTEEGEAHADLDGGHLHCGGGLT